MKKVIRLKESDLVRIVKRVLQEQYVAQPDATRVKMPNLYTPSSETSKKGMEPKGLGRFEEYLDFIKLLDGEVLPRLQIIFPGDERYQEVFVQFLKGINFFSSDEHTYIVPAFKGFDKIIYDYTSRNIKFRQILVGTHGRCSESINDLVINGNVSIGNDFFKKLKGLVNSDTHIYLTSCNAAGEVGGYIARIHKLAIDMGCKVTAASGLNYLGYDSENGFYTCRPEGQQVGSNYQNYRASNYQAAKKYCSFSPSPPFTPNNINKLSNVYNNVNTGVVDGVQKMVNTIFKK